MRPMPAPAPLRWYHRPVWVLVLLFVVLGPLGLPYLWGSPAFSRRMKVVLSALVAVYTGLFIGETIHVVRAMMGDLDALEKATRF